MAHCHASTAYTMSDRALKTSLLGVGPVDVLLMPVSHQTIHERPIQTIGFLVNEVGLTVGILDNILRRLLATPAAIIDTAVVRIHRAQMRTVGRVGLAYLLGKRSASLTTIPNGFLGYIGLNVVGHLERRMKMNVNAVMQRSGIIETVIERGGHFLVNRKRHCEDGQNLKLRVFRIAFVNIVQIDAAVPASTAPQRANLQILEGVVAHKRSEGLAYDLGRNSHYYSPLRSSTAFTRQH